MDLVLGGFQMVLRCMSETTVRVDGMEQLLVGGQMDRKCHRYTRMVLGMAKRQHEALTGRQSMSPQNPM